MPAAHSLLDAYRPGPQRAALVCAQALHLKTKPCTCCSTWSSMPGSCDQRGIIRDGVAGAGRSEGIDQLHWRAAQGAGRAAQAPRFIATGCTAGYRFIAPVTLVGSSEATAPAPRRGPDLHAPPLLVGREAEVRLYATA
jgi:hypothetical protein